MSKNSSFMKNIQLININGKIQNRGLISSSGLDWIKGWLKLKAQMKLFQRVRSEQNKGPGVSKG